MANAAPYLLNFEIKQIILRHKELLMYTLRRACKSSIFHTLRLSNIISINSYAGGNKTQKIFYQANRSTTSLRALMVLRVFMLMYFSHEISCKADVIKNSTNNKHEYIELYEHWKVYALDSPPADAVPIILQIPEQFKSEAFHNITRNWGVNFLIYYPSFKNAQPSGGHDYVVTCGVRILVSIENHTHTIHHPELTQGVDYPNMGDFIARVRLKNPIVPINSTINELGQRFGFNQGYEVAQHTNDNIINQSRQYLFHGSENNNYDVAAECNINKFAQTCSIHFSASCNPSIYVHISGVEMNYMNIWREYVSNVDKFVSDMVKDHECIIK